jgi:hypothetical protein
LENKQGAKHGSKHEPKLGKKEPSNGTSKESNTWKKA